MPTSMSFIVYFIGFINVDQCSETKVSQFNDPERADKTVGALQTSMTGQDRSVNVLETLYFNIKAYCR